MIHSNRICTYIESDRKFNYKWHHIALSSTSNIMNLNYYHWQQQHKQSEQHFKTIHKLANTQQQQYLQYKEDNNNGCWYQFLYVYVHMSLV